MRVISFVNMKGGVGKTTTAINVADCLARAHDQKVAVIDVDPQFNATQCLFSADDYVKMLRNGIDTVMDVFGGTASVSASVVTGSETKEPKNLEDLSLSPVEHLWVLPGNINLYRLEMQSGEGREFSLKRFIEKVIEPEGFDYVVIDTPPTPSVWMTSALIASDYYVIPVKPDPLSIVGIDLLSSIVERRKNAYDLGIECLGLIFTIVDRPDSVAYADARAALEENALWSSKAFEAYLPKRTAYARSQLEAPFFLRGDDYNLRQGLTSLVDEMLERIDGN